MPISTASAPASDRGLDHQDPVVAVAAGDVGDEQLAAGVAARPQRLLEAGGGHRQPARVLVVTRVPLRCTNPSNFGEGRRHPRRSLRMSITWATSLSPRPDRFTSTVRPASAARSRHDPGQRVGRLEGGDDALGAAQQLERVEHLVVGDRLVAGPADVGQVGVLGPDARVVEPGRDRLGLEHLAVLVLQEERLRAVHDAGDAVADGGPAGRLDADELRRRCRRSRRRCRRRSSRRRRRPRRRRDAAVEQGGGTARGPRRRCTRWNSRTIHGYGCGPITEPRQ